MKRKIQLLLIIVPCLAYFGAYFIVRSTFEKEGVEFKPDSSGHGYLPPVEFTSTEFYAPPNGNRRFWQYFLYYAYFPLGKLESSITDRKYEIMDGQNTLT